MTNVPVTYCVSIEICIFSETGIFISCFFFLDGDIQSGHKHLSQLNTHGSIAIFCLISVTFEIYKIERKFFRILYKMIVFKSSLTDEPEIQEIQSVRDGGRIDVSIVGASGGGGRLKRHLGVYIYL